MSRSPDSHRSSDPSARPRLELRPLRRGVASDRSTILDLLVVVHPPELDERTVKRPPLNLGLVLDRSGSMHGQKLAFAKEAAKFAVSQLLARDRVALVTYDDQIGVEVPSTLVSDKAALQNLIDRIDAGGTTALHDGWTAGGSEVARAMDQPALQEGTIHRVLLLSDGLANVGMTNADDIASDVRRLRERGIGTSTMGVGDDYDEVLLEGMAQAGDGNFYHIASPRQIPDFFASELEELVAMFAENVSLGVRARNGIEVVDVLNDFDRTDFGNWMLPSLVAGSPLQVLLRLRVPALRAESGDLGPQRLAAIRLAWDRPGRGRRDLYVDLELPVLPSDELDHLPTDDAVRSAEAVFQAQRAKREMMEAARQGRYNDARQAIRRSAQMVGNAPSSLEVLEERVLHRALAQRLEEGDVDSLLKHASYERYARRRSRRVRRPPSE